MTCIAGSFGPDWPKNCGPDASALHLRRAGLPFLAELHSDRFALLDQILVNSRCIVSKLCGVGIPTSVDFLEDLVFPGLPVRRVLLAYISLFYGIHWIR